MHKFTNPDTLVGHIGLAPGMRVADLGCGAGYYVVPAAKTVGKTGHVLAIDIMPAMCEVAASTVRNQGLRNVTVEKLDLTKPLHNHTKIKHSSFDACIVGNILHQVEDIEQLIKNVYYLLKTGGRVLVVEWKQESLIGPPHKSRFNPKSLEKHWQQFGFRTVEEIPTDTAHFAFLLEK